MLKLDGMKTYLAATIAVLTALLAFLNGELDILGLVGALSSAGMVAGLRRAITTAVRAILGDGVARTIFQGQIPIKDESNLTG